MIIAIDYAILHFYHTLAVLTHGVLTPVMIFVSMTCNLRSGYPILIFGIVLLFFKKTRKMGIGVLLAILFCQLFQEQLLKTLIGRVRPYNSGNAQIVSWWKYAGAVSEGKTYSCPSGHATTMMASMVVMYCMTRKKYSWLFIVVAIIVGLSRNYLMVHYPSDVLLGFLVGAFIGYLTYRLVTYQKILKRRSMDS
jgi:undecaprenyl-diphosphatase